MEIKPWEWKQAGKLGEGVLGWGSGWLPAGSRSEFLWVRDGGSWLGSRAREGCFITAGERDHEGELAAGVRAREIFLSLIHI